jgi:hypothetical protein
MRILRYHTPMPQRTNEERNNRYRALLITGYALPMTTMICSLIAIDIAEQLEGRANLSLSPAAQRYERYLITVPTVAVTGCMAGIAVICASRSMRASSFPTGIIKAITIVVTLALTWQSYVLAMAFIAQDHFP